MKLWLKISLLCAVVLLVIVIACSALLLLQSRDSVVNLAIEYAKAKQHGLAASFSEMVEHYLTDDIGEAAEYTLVDYCFKRLADQEGILIKNGERSSSQAGIAPETLLPIENADQHVLNRGVQRRNILIVGSQVTFRQESYAVYIVQDITPVYSAVKSMMWRFALIALAGIVLGAGLIIVLVRRSTKPLLQLGQTTRKIAAGDYGQRAAILKQDEVGLLAEDFNRMAEAVQTRIADLTETAARQQLFIGGVTHEFKTPMTSLLIHSDTLLNTRLKPQEQQRSLIHIRQQVAWLERLTQKLLRLVTLCEEIALQTVSVPELFEAVQESALNTLLERGTPLHIDCKVDALRMDADLMHSLLVNLVDNASKASQKGQAIVLRAYEHTIEVQDAGSGIPQGEIARVTEPFYMVDRSRSKKKGGAGLGLALVQQIAQAHGAELRITSEILHGTTVKIIFPDNNSLTL